MIAVRLLPDNRLEAVIWDVTTGAVRHRIPLPASAYSKNVEIYRIDVRPDGKAVGLTSGGGPMFVFEIPSGRELARLDTPVFKWEPKFSADGESLVFGTANGSAMLWNWRTANDWQEFHGHSGQVMAADISPDGKTLATGDGVGNVRLWNVQSGQEMLTLPTTNSNVQSLVFSNDGLRLACWCRDYGFGGPSLIQIWSIE